jgi:hypothetical protein
VTAQTGAATPQRPTPQQNLELQSCQRLERAADHAASSAVLVFLCCLDALPYLVQEVHDRDADIEVL